KSRPLVSVLKIPSRTPLKPLRKPAAGSNSESKRKTRFRRPESRRRPLVNQGVPFSAPCYFGSQRKERPGRAFRDRAVVPLCRSVFAIATQFQRLAGDPSVLEFAEQPVKTLFRQLHQ